MRKVYKKILNLVLITSIASIAFYLIIMYVHKKQNESNQTKTQTDFNNLTKLVYNSEFEKYKSYMSDLTYWDEFVDFINKKKDRQWFDESVATAFQTYDAKSITILNSKGEIVVDTISKEFKYKKSYRNYFASLKKLDKNKLIYFYDKTDDNRLIQIIGSTVHASNDFERKQKPSGYFIITRFINSNYLNKLSEISESNVSFQQKENSNFKTNLYSKKSLKNFNNLDIATLTFTKPKINQNDQLQSIIYLCIAITLLNISIFFYFLRKWVNSPLQLVTNVLTNKNPEDLLKLKVLDTEFGTIGKHIEEKNEQESLLINAKLKAEENDKLKSVFLANLSHEIRTPMNAILGFTNLLKNEKLNESDKVEFLNTIEISGNNLILIINDLIEMSKIDVKQIEIKYRPIDIQKQINELFETLKGIIPKEKNLKLILVQPDIKPKYPVLTDEIKLKQILTNLITNAIKYTQDGEISIGYTIDKKHTQIKFFVQDSGFGISAEEQKVIFDRFKRLENDYTVKTSGLGLGLAISKAYVDLMEGEISLKSKKNIGTTFYVNFPLIYDKNKTTETKINNFTPNLANKNLNNIKILVAEDDNINYLLFQKMLISLPNLQLTRAKDGQEAIEIYQKNNNFDMIFLDIKMPKLNGFEVQQKLKELNNTLPVIAQTAFASPDEINEVTNAKFDNYILKPLNKTKLIEMITFYSHKNEE